MRTLALIAAVAALFSPVLPALADELQIKDGAPERYVVVRGDTLWDISAKFLNSPWRWPELWQINKEAVHNPHLIYPGDTLMLVYDANGRPQLKVVRPENSAGDDTPRVVKLSPKVRAEPIARLSSLPTLPYEEIAPFLNRNQVVEREHLDTLPRILGDNSNRVMFSTGDTVFATAGETSQKDWQVVRVGRALIDPDNQTTLGYVLEHLADAETIKTGSPQEVRLTGADKEVLERDLLMPIQNDTGWALMPHAPQQEINAKVITALGGAEGAGHYATIVLNKGAASGLEVGHTLALFRPGRQTDDPRCRRGEKLGFLSAGFGARDVECAEDTGGTLPEQRIGLTVIYKLFGNMAFGLVMESTEPVYPNTLVRNP